MRTLRRAVLLAFFVGLVGPPPGPAAQQRELTLDAIYHPDRKVDFGGSPVSDLEWLDDRSYLERRESPDGDGHVLLEVDARSGDAAPFVDSATFQAALEALPGFTAETAREIARRGRWQMNPQRTAILLNEADDLFHWEIGTDRAAARLTADAEPEVGEEFSPDGELVSFVRDWDVWVVDPDGGDEWALTSGGSEELLHGRLDWVYQEEIYGRGNFKGYWWSPDSSRIVYLELDESPVMEYTVVDHIPYRPELEVTNYPKAGDLNPVARLGLVGARGGGTTWVDTFEYQAFDHLIVRVGWKPDGSRVVFQVQDREQTWLDLNLADPATGEVEALLRETSPAWTEVYENPTWLSDGSFLWLSHRTGWTHLYRVDPGGGEPVAVTAGEWEARTLHGVDEEAGWVYLSGTERSHIGSDVYRVALDGSDLTRLRQREGTHRASFSPGFEVWSDSWSDVRTPTQVRLHEADDGAVVRVVDANPVPELDEYRLGEVEFLQVPTRDGFTMEAMIIRPPDFDPGERYPVMSYTYSGPHAPSVRNAWGGTRYMWHQMLAGQGHVIWICDNRSASGKGVQSTWTVYENFGEGELRDLEDGIAWLKERPWIDGDRIGLWGWSFGGYMTAYALTHSTSFKIGVAGAPVTDWRDYDTIYTERYMRMPQNNPEGYERSAPVNAAADLHGRLLVVHGTMDDNVHLQNTIQFLYALQKAHRQVEAMFYPRSRHGIRDEDLTYHLQTLITAFIREHL